MPLRPLALPTEPPEVQFAVEGLAPGGYVTLVFGPQGNGKTRLLSHLAAQAARPAGDFAGRRVKRGKTLILDADDPQALGYALWVNRFLRGYPDADRDLIELRAVDGGLTPDDLQDLIAELVLDPPTFIVLDAFSSAFLGVDPLKPHTVHGPIRALTSLAVATGASVLLVDHVGKVLPGQTVASKGALGSVIKQASPRAVYALERVPPRGCGGEDVTRLICTKQSYGPLPPPLGLRLVWDGEDACRMEPYALPESDTLEDRAKLALLAALRAAGEQGLRRADLLAYAVQQANVSTRTAERALADLIRQDPAIEERQLPERGAPKLIVYVGLAANNQNAVQDEKRFSAKALAENPNLAGNPGPEAETEPEPEWEAEL
jgi:RecA/RadA recombinase